MTLAFMPIEDMPSEEWINKVAMILDGSGFIGAKSRLYFPEWELHEPLEQLAKSINGCTPVHLEYFRFWPNEPSGIPATKYLFENRLDHDLDTIIIAAGKEFCEKYPALYCHHMGIPLNPVTDASNTPNDAITFYELQPPTITNLIIPK